MDLLRRILALAARLELKHDTEDLTLLQFDPLKRSAFSAFARAHPKSPQPSLGGALPRWVFTTPRTQRRLPYSHFRLAQARQGPAECRAGNITQEIRDQCDTAANRSDFNRAWKRWSSVLKCIWSTSWLLSTVMFSNASFSVSFPDILR